MEKNTRIYVAGHRGLAGSAIWNHLQEEGYDNLIGASSSEVDLRDRPAVFDFLRSSRPEVVIDAAAKVGGIAANDIDVDRLLFLGSSCIYPKFAAQPIKESSLLTGELEPTNDAYAIAKIAGIMQVQASRKQYGRHWISAMPTNLYGPGDNFHPENSHVLPALLRRIHQAKVDEAPEVVIWGSGTPLREFLYVGDLADASLFLLDNYDSPETINVGFGKDLSIHDLARIVADIVGYQGVLKQDPTKPDGTPRKLLDVSRINDLGWHARTGLVEGISATYTWYLENITSVRTR